MKNPGSFVLRNVADMNLTEAANLMVGALIAKKADPSETFLIVEKDDVFTMRDNLGRIDFARFDEWPFWDAFVRIA